MILWLSSCSFLILSVLKSLLIRKDLHLHASYDEPKFFCFTRIHSCLHLDLKFAWLDLFLITFWIFLCMRSLKKIIFFPSSVKDFFFEMLFTSANLPLSLYFSSLLCASYCVFISRKQLHKALRSLSAMWPFLSKRCHSNIWKFSLNCVAFLFFVLLACRWLSVLSVYYLVFCS